MFPKASIAASAAFAPIHSHGHSVTHAQRVVRDRLRVDVDIKATISRSTVPATSGAVIDGVALVGGLSAQVIFRNDSSGIHPYLLSGCADVELIERRRRLPLRRSGTLARSGRDPIVVLEWFDAAARPLGAERVLGRLSEAPFEASFATSLPMGVAVSIAALEYDRERGPTLELSGESVLEGGIMARLAFRDEARAPRDLPGPDALGLVVLPTGVALPLTERLVCADVGGHPTISIRFRDASGAPVSVEYVVGRCVNVDA